MGAVTPGETLGTLYNIHVGSNKTKQHTVTVTGTQAHCWHLLLVSAGGTVTRLRNPF